MLAGIALFICVAGLAQTLVACGLAFRFTGPHHREPVSCPPVTILKPLHGDEPLLEPALCSFCELEWPEYQIVFGVQDPQDPAIAVVDRLRARYPARDITLIVDARYHGPNRKVGNLINMLPAAKHGVLVIADSDLHVRPDYLASLVAALEQPGVGLATTLYTGLPADNHAVARLGATQITHGFLPGALLARAMGREDCLGATMVIHRATLTRIGGLHALVGHLADDNVLGQLVRGLGLRIALASTVPATTVPETSLRDLFQHELRWARTIRALEPLAFAASSVQFSLTWAWLVVALTEGAAWAWGLFALTWALRALAARGIDRALRERAILGKPVPVWLLPFRDLFSIAVLLAAHTGTGVVWRGHGLHADTPDLSPDRNTPLPLAEGPHPR